MKLQKIQDIETNMWPLLNKESHIMFYDIILYYNHKYIFFDIFLINSICGEHPPYRRVTSKEKSETEKGLTTLSNSTTALPKALFKSAFQCSNLLLRRVAGELISQNTGVLTIICIHKYWIWACCLSN